MYSTLEVTLYCTRTGTVHTYGQKLTQANDKLEMTKSVILNISYEQLSAAYVINLNIKYKGIVREMVKTYLIRKAYVT